MSKISKITPKIGSYDWVDNSSVLTSSSSQKTSSNTSEKSNKIVEKTHTELTNEITDLKVQVAMLTNRLNWQLVHSVEIPREISTGWRRVRDSHCPEG